MEPSEAVRAAIGMAQDGLNAGEMPIGAVVLAGNEVLARSFAQEQLRGRRIAHADLLAMQEADRVLGFRRTALPLTLAVNLEPCLMCIGAAITLGVENIWFGLESPNDGAAALLEHWNPPIEQTFFRKPRQIRGGFHRDVVRRQFAAYAASSGPVGMREWASGLAQESDVPAEGVGTAGAPQW